MTNNIKPKQILLFQEDEIALGYESRLPSGIKMKDIDVKSIEYDVEEVKSKYVLLGEQPNEHSVYYLHPYQKNTYVNEKLGEDFLLRAKMELYKKVGQLLGAKSISIDVLSINNCEIKININVEGRDSAGVITGGIPIGAGVKVENTDIRDYKRKFEISSTYCIQNDFDLDKNIDELRDMIDQFNLHHETDLVSLINDRDVRSSGGSMLKSRSIKSEISSEYNKILDISLKLSVPDVFDLSSEFNRNTRIIKKIEVNINYEF